MKHQNRTLFLVFLVSSLRCWAVCLPRSCKSYPWQAMLFGNCGSVEVRSGRLLAFLLRLFYEGRLRGEPESSEGSLVKSECGSDGFLCFSVHSRRPLRRVRPRTYAGRFSA